MSRNKPFANTALDTGEMWSDLLDPVAKQDISYNRWVKLGLKQLGSVKQRCVNLTTPPFNLHPDSLKPGVSWKVAMTAACTVLVSKPFYSLKYPPTPFFKF